MSAIGAIIGALLSSLISYKYYKENFHSEWKKGYFCYSSGVLGIILGSYLIYSPLYFLIFIISVIFCSLLDMMFDDEPPVAQSADIQRAGPAASGQQEHLPEEDREFESIIMRAQGFDDFRQQGQSLKGILSDVEQDIIQRALSETDGNVSRCAKLLRMQRTTLIERIKKYDLKVVAA